MNVMLLAAGEGTRLRPYTNILPKPAIPFLTVPLAAHALGFLRQVQINKLVVNTFHLPNKIHELFHKLPHGARELSFSDEVGEILGSGGGLGKARQHFLGGGDFLMMNADEVILPKDEKILLKALEAHRKSQALATLLVMDHAEVGSQFGGAWTDVQGNILGFGKTPTANSVKGWHFIGVQILSERIFDFIPKEGPSNILYDAVTQGVAAGCKAQVFPIECEWFETGNPKDFLAASQKCLQFLKDDTDSYEKRSLQATLNCFQTKMPLVSSVDGNLRMSTDSSQIAESAQLEGPCVIGAHSSIGPGSRLKNVVIGDGVAIPANTVAADVLFI